MTRPRLITSIPFWVLFLGSLALTGFGAWMVFDRLTTFQDSVRSGAADQAQQLDISISTYTVGPAATVGGIILGAGVVGLLLTAALGAISTILPRPAVEVVEAIDWTDEDESALDDAEPAASAASVAPASEDRAPASGSVAPASGSAATDAPAPAVTASEPAAPASDDATPEPVSEDPDVETPSDAPAPTRADLEPPTQR